MADVRNLLLVGSLTLAASSAFVQSNSKADVPKSGLTFKKDLTPLVSKYCAGCHTGKAAPANFDISKYKTEAAIKADLATWERVSRALSTGHMPPKGMPQPPIKLRKAAVDWIDATITGDCRLADPGRVTIRRLNREEYSNTIRDLIGLDLRPAEDFPSDDVGYGFDNIGDVLSISPLLMDKYLDAADKIAKAAIVIPASKSSILQAEDVGRGDGEFAVLVTRSELPFQYPFQPGMYKLKVRAYEDHAGPENAKMLLSVDGVSVQEFEVAATRRKPAMYEVPFRATAANKSISVTFLNDFYNPQNAVGDRDRNLNVDYLQVDGPLGGTYSIPESHRRIIPSEPPKGKERDYARRILANFASRAYRRPAAPEEVERLMTMFDLAMKFKEPFERGIQLGVQATLVSPNFLFRAELDPKLNPKSARVLNGYELASRLSYFLWSSMPDDRLLMLAGDGSLSKLAILESEVRRMLKDPKSRALADNFAAQWLTLRKLQIIVPDPKQFPTYSKSLRDAMAKETKLFFGAVVSEDRSIVDFLNGKFTYVNGELAKHYGLAGVAGDEFRKVSLAGTERGGVLTQASVLTVTSNPTRTSPTKRGRWVLEQILGTPPPPPPPGADQLPDDAKRATGRNLRELMVAHREKPECANCHAKMDPLGFGLENFDPIGAWRSIDGGEPVDSSGELPGGIKFVGPTQLTAILLKSKDQFVRAFSEKMLTYALGRGLSVADKCHIDSVALATKKGNDKFSSLVIAIVKSDPFRLRGSKP